LDLSDSQKIVKNIFSLSTAEIFSKGLQLFLAFYLMSVLDVENYGVWNFAKTHVSIYLVAIILGFNTVGTREIAKDINIMPKYVNTIITIRLFSALLAYGVLLVIVFTTLAGDHVKQIVVLIFGIKIFSDGLLINWVFEGLQKMHINAIRSVVTSVIGTVGILFVVHDPDDIIIATWIMSGAYAANTIWMLIYYYKKYSPIRLELDTQFPKKILTSAIPIGIAFFIVSLYNSLDAQMLEFMFDDDDLSNYFNGIYGSAHQVVLAAMIPSGIFQGAFFPQFSQKFSNAIDFDNLMQKFTKLTFNIGIFGGLILFLFSNHIFDFFIDMGVLETNFSETGEVLKYLSFTIIIIYVNITYFAPLIAAGMERQVLWANLAGLIANGVVNYLLIPEYNVFGAAIATIGSEVGVLLILIYLFKKKFGKLYLRNLLKIFLICLLSVSPYLLNYFIDLNFIIVIMACILFFIILNFVFGTFSVKELKGILKR
jgi:O-antigen/teichoic acid export membrane protein